LKEYNLKDYSIYIGPEVFDLLLEQLIERSYSQVFVLVDENTEKHCLPILTKTLFDVKVIKIASGEEYKTVNNLQFIWDELIKNQADKQTALINLGGGVIGDMGGFAAATFKRGIDFINVPTTLLAMVDSSIGGKLGVDYLGIKNAVGMIKNPSSVFISVDFLSTLPKRELLNGFAEIIKHAAIKDASMLKELNQNNLAFYQKNKKALAALIQKNVEIKVKVVQKDEFEKGDRKLLNFGHTLGHAIENEHALLHGHAISIGMVYAA
jgi:3-dehydroquinate synthase